MAQNLIYQTISIWLLFFYTNVFGLDPASAGTMFLIVIIIDILWNPIVGTLIDMHHPKFGKYRTYLIFGGIPLTIFSILCFYNGFSGSLIYAYITYIGMSMCYSLVNIPYCALNSSLTRDPEEITILTTTRMILANLGGLAVSSGLPIIIAIFAPKDTNGIAVINTPDASWAWFITMLIVSCVGLVLLFFSFSQTKEKVVMEKSTASKIKFIDLINEFKNNNPLRVLSYFFITIFTLVNIVNAAGTYFMAYNIGASANEISIFVGLSIVPAFIFLPLIPAIKKAIGKKQLIYVCLTIILIGLAMLFLVNIISDLKNNMYFIYASQFIKSTGVVMVVTCMWNLVPEVITYGEYKTGRRNAAIVNSLNAIFIKIGLAFGAAIPGFILAAVGFNADLGSNGQTDLSLQGIVLLMCIIPALLAILGMFITSKYKITDHQLIKINKEIEKNKILK